MAGLDSFHQRVGKWFHSLSCCKDEDEDECKPVIGKPFDFRREDPCIAGLSSEEQEALRIRAVSDATRMFATLQPITHNGKINKSSRTTIPSSPKTSTIPSPKPSTPATFKSSSLSTTSKPSLSTTKSSFSAAKSSTTKSSKSSTPLKPSPSGKASPSTTNKPTPSNAKVAKNKWITNPIIGNSDVTYTLSPSLLEPNRPSLPRQNSSHSGKGGGVKGMRPLALITDSEIINGISDGRSGEMGRSEMEQANVGVKLLTHSRGGITSPSPKTAGYASLHTISTTGLDTGRTPLLEHGEGAITSPFDLQTPGPEAGRRNSHGHGQGQYQMNLLPSPVSSRMEGLDFDFGSFSGQGGLGHDGRKGSGFAHEGNEEVFARDGEKAEGNAEHDQDRDSGKYVRGR